MSARSRRESAPQPDALCGKHLRIGWWSLLLFLTLGIGLEALHGLKVGLYLDVSNETRRLMWTLAHAHGSLLAVVNVAFGITTRLVPDWQDDSRTWASRLHLVALVLLPLGFFAGGIALYGGDPGPGILLVPPGGLALLAAVFLTARGAARA